MKIQVHVFMVLMSLLVVPIWSKDRVEIPALFVAPDFRFSDVDTVCVAPPVDLRADKSQAIVLTGSGPRLDFRRTGGADNAVVGGFEAIGYKITPCDPVGGAPDDLRAQPDTWLQKLNFGGSRWLFIFGVEDVSAAYAYHGLLGNSQGYAVVSGYLLERRADGVRMKWRDRVVGVPNLIGQVQGKKDGVKTIESDFAIADGARHLLNKFETRKRSINYHLPLSQERDSSRTFDVSCNALWAAVQDTLKDPKESETIEVYNSDMMAIYTVGTSGKKEERRINYLVLKGTGNSCDLQVTETAPFTPFRNNGEAMIKRVQAALIK